MALKLPRTIRLDASDTFVFPRAAEPGEWAVTGTFLFVGRDEAVLTGKERQAFRGGFVGIDSFGWSTLVVVSKASPQEREEAIQGLLRQLMRHCGAPDTASARAAAEEEIAFAESLCGHPEGTLLGLHRSADGDSIRESFRSLHRRPESPGGLRAFRLEEIEDEQDAGEDIDLAAMAEKR